MVLEKDKLNHDFCSFFTSFMSDKIFAYLAYRCGFEICNQKVIDWGVENLDCISLIMKPY